MKSLLFYAVLPILTVSLTVACSKNDDASPSTSRLNEVAVQDANDMPSPKMGVAEAGVEISPERETPIALIRSAESHTHGDAKLAVVLEGGAVNIEFESPLYNILGFEHAPETDAQLAIVSNAQAQLVRGAELFTFDDKAGCEVTRQDQVVKLFGGGGDSEAHHDNHDRGHEGHDEHHDDDGNGHEDDHSDHRADTHKDVLLSYAFFCQDTSALSNMSINLFEFFDELSELDVTFLASRAQRQVILTRNNTQMDLLK